MTVTGKNVRSHNSRTFDDASGRDDNCCRVPVSAHFIFERDRLIRWEFEYGEVPLELICDRIAQKFGVDLETLERIAEEKGEQNT